MPIEGPERGHLKQFLTVPLGAETCGPFITGDDRSVFVAVQHPGEITGATVDEPGVDLAGRRLRQARRGGHLAPGRRPDRQLTSARASTRGRGLPSPPSAGPPMYSAPHASAIDGPNGPAGGERARLALAREQPPDDLGRYGAGPLLGLADARPSPRGSVPSAHRSNACPMSAHAVLGRAARVTSRRIANDRTGPIASSAVVTDGSARITGHGRRLAGPSASGRRAGRWSWAPASARRRHPGHGDQPAGVGQRQPHGFAAEQMRADAPG